MFCASSLLMRLRSLRFLRARARSINRGAHSQHLSKSQTHQRMSSKQKSKTTKKEREKKENNALPLLSFSRHIALFKPTTPRMAPALTSIAHDAQPIVPRRPADTRYPRRRVFQLVILQFHLFFALTDVLGMQHGYAC